MKATLFLLLFITIFVKTRSWNEDTLMRYRRCIKPHMFYADRNMPVAEAKQQLLNYLNVLQKNEAAKTSNSKARKDVLAHINKAGEQVLSEIENKNYKND